MAIRHAKPEDVDKIKELAESLKYNPKKPKSGAIVTVLSRNEYLFRIKNSRFFYVDFKGNDLNGFLISDDSELIKTLYQNNMFHHEEVLPFLSKCKQPFLYGESIGVRDDKQRTGIGNSLISRWLKDAEEADIKDLYVLIRHSPDKNINSISLSIKKGFRYFGTEVTKKEFVHGIYERKIRD